MQQMQHTPLIPRDVPLGQKFWADLENPVDVSDEEVRQAEQLLTGQEP